MNAPVRREMLASRRLAFVLAITTLFSVPAAFWPLTSLRAQSQVQGSETDSKAIKQAVAEFYEAFSRHDAHAVAMTFAEDADFTNMAGAHNRGRKEIEDHFARVFAGNLKDARRTDTVRSIRFVSPQVAEVDADTVITGTKAADGAEVPPRKGLMVT